jgi:hypothetical protein
MTDQPPTAGRYGGRSESHSSLREIRSPIVCHQKITWRTNVLPGTIRSNWDNLSRLYNVIVAALNDGFRADILKATEQI